MEQQQEQGDNNNVVTNGETMDNSSSSSVVTPEYRKLLRDLFEEYYRNVEKHLVKEHKMIKKLDHRNREILYTRGELPEEIKQDYEKSSKIYEKLLNNTQT